MGSLSGYSKIIIKELYWNSSQEILYEDCKPSDTSIAKGEVPYELFWEERNVEDSSCISSKKFDVCTDLCAAKYCIDYWDVRQVLK